MHTVTWTGRTRQEPAPVDPTSRRRTLWASSRPGRVTRRRYWAWAATAVLVAVLATLVMGLVGLAPPASAHTGLVSSRPAADARLTTPPGQLQLTFSDDVTPEFADVALSVGGGSTQALRTETNGAVVTATPPTAGDGGSQVWKVAYRVVPGDGHPISGTFTFTVGQDSPEPTKGPSNAGPAPSPSATPSTTSPPANAPVTDLHERRKNAWLLIPGVALLLLAPIAAALYGVGKPEPDPSASDEPAEGPSATQPEKDPDDLSKSEPLDDPPVDATDKTEKPARDH